MDNLGSMADDFDIDKSIEDSNGIIEGYETSSQKVKVSSENLYYRATVDTIKYNKSKPPFTAYTLVAANINNKLRKILKSNNSTFEQALTALREYLANGYDILLSQKDEEVISKKYSLINEELVNNTTILRNDLQALLLSNLGRGVPDAELVMALKNLYPAYAKNAYTIINTGLSRQFIDTNVTKFRQQKYEWYIWAGPKDSLTRENPCRHWVWHRFPSSQLDRLSGVRQSLFNCRHSIQPLNEDMLADYPIGNINAYKP